MKTLICAAALLAAGVPAIAAAATAPAVAASAAAGPREPEVHREVIEDKSVRIEELRVRGETQSITVKSRLRALPYEYQIVPSSASRDPSQPDAGSAGQPRWHLFSY